MDEVDPKEAARELKRQARQSQTAKPMTAGELGLAIASLVVGVLIAISTIPVTYWLGWVHDEGAATHVCSMLPFAICSAVCGYIGRKSALGVAGLVLSIVACVEAGVIVGVLQYNHATDNLNALRIEKFRKEAQSIENEVQNGRVAIANADTARHQIDREIELIKQSCAQSEREKVSNLALIEKLKVDAAKALNDSILERDTREQIKLAEIRQKELERKAAQDAIAKEKREATEKERQAAIDAVIAKDKADQEAKEKAAVEKLKAAAPVYVLKDKRRIRALEIKENSSDFWSIKDDTGKTLMIDKADVVEIIFSNGDR